MKDLLSVTFLIFAVYGGLIGQTFSFSTPFKHVPLARTSGAQFGYAVDISGDFFVIGAPFETDDQSGGNSLADAGAVYVFERNQAGSWVEVQKLVPSDRSAGDQFGFSVAMEGEQVVVGAPEEDHNESGNQFLDGSGSIYVFEKSPAGVWLETDKLVAWDRDAQDFFGYSVGISNSRILVGAEREDHNVTGGVYQPSAGSAYLFEKDINGNWQPDQKLVAQDRSTSDFFGSAVAICDSQVVIGAYREDEDANGLNRVGSAGSCYIFELGASGVWAQTAKLVAPDRASSDFFGFSVSIDTNRMVAGAYAEDHDSGFGNRASSAGSAYVFSKNTSGTWSFEQKLTASDREVGDEFGYSLDILGDSIVVGAHQEDIDQGAFSISGAGSIYIFARSSGSWSERAKVFAQAYGTQDYFGRAVSVDASGIVVGAPFSDFTTNDEAGAAFFVDMGPTPLSITLLSFTGTALPAGNQLGWQTNSESTEGRFWVERRVPQTGEYIAIGLVERQPSEGVAKSYRFLDTSPPTGRSLYRLKMVDLDGTVSYSRLIELLPARAVGLRVFPNPASHRVIFRTLSSAERLKQIEIYDGTGRLIRDVPLGQVSLSQYDVLLGGLPEGVYLYQVVTEDGHYTGLIELSK